MKKRAAAIVLISFLAAALWSGCAKGKEEHGLEKESPVELTLWHYYNGAQAVAFEDLVQEFNSTVGMEQGIIIASESKGSIEDLADALEDSVDKKVGAEQMPNIFQSYLDVAMKIDEKGMLTDLSQYITQEEQAEYVDSYVEEGTYFKDGKWKLFPIAKANELLTVNKTVWDRFAEETGAKEELLSTWEGMTELGKLYYDWSGGKSFFGRDAFANYLIVGSVQLGKELFLVEDGQVTLQMDRDIMKKLWNNFYVPYVKGYFSQTGRYRSDDMKIGNIIAGVSSTSGISFFSDEVTISDEESYPVEYKVLPVPGFEGTKSCVVQQGASMAVTKSTEKEEYASIVFLKWFTESDRNIEFSINSGYLPVKKEANNLEKIMKCAKNNEISLRPIQEEAIKVSVGQVQNSRLYTTKGFEGGDKARHVLNTTMLDLAVADAKSAAEEMKSGKTEEEVLEPYLSEEYFEQWYQDTQKQLMEACGE